MEQLFKMTAIGDVFIYTTGLQEMQKPRPVLVVSNPNSKGNIQVLIGSSKLENWNEKYQLIIEPNDLSNSKLNSSVLFPVSKLILADPNLFKYYLGGLKGEKLKEILTKITLFNAETYYHSIHKPKQENAFIPGETRVPYAGRVFDEKEICNLVDSSLEFWLTTGRYAEEFEKKFSAILGVKHTLLVNSGSSANLLAFWTLTSPSLKERQIRRGDEVISVAAGFPTTVNPILQYGAIPVFVDVDIPTYNIDVSKLEEALSPKTKAVMVAHALGNPFNLQAVKDFCTKHNLWLIEDNCDALGSRYLYNGEWKYTGTIGDIGTSSFYPPHHLTMGEGGAVYMNSNKLKKIAESFRDWGRDCWCPSGKDDTCGKRFKWNLGELPKGYDHKYIYSHFGFNLKVTDMQASVGVAQLDKLSGFVAARKRNWQKLRDGLNLLNEKVILPEPTQNSDPSWFGFLITIRDAQVFTRSEIVNFLEGKGIQTRMLFAGNLIKHPCFDELRKSGEGYRVIGDLKNTNKIMEDTFWVGVYPGLTDDKIDYIIKMIIEAFNK